MAEALLIQVGIKAGVAIYKEVTKPKHCAHCAGIPGRCKCPYGCTTFHGKRSQCHSSLPCLTDASSSMSSLSNSSASIQQLPSQSCVYPPMNQPEGPCPAASYTVTQTVVTTHAPVPLAENHHAATSKSLPLCRPDSPGYVQSTTSSNNSVYVPSSNQTLKTSKIDSREKHHGVYCLGARCFSVVTYIVGPRYVCADCPPSIDLCSDCYDSGTAHDMSHTFKRFDKGPTIREPPCVPVPKRQQIRGQDSLCGMKCSDCKKGIRGARFLCTTCGSFDGCELCYHRHSDSHSFVMFASPNSDPVPVPARNRKYRKPTTNFREEENALYSLSLKVCTDCKAGIAGARFLCTTCDNFDGCELCHRAHSDSHSFVKFATSTSNPVPVPPRKKTSKKSTIDSREKHHGVYCLGAGCFSAVTYIKGPRYVCAVCPPSVDLCGDCYGSGTAHDMTHTFKRFDKRVTANECVYTLCPPHASNQSLTKKQTRRSSRFHGTKCTDCKAAIEGARFLCTTCDNFDGCEVCQRAHSDSHSDSHSFVKFATSTSDPVPVPPKKKTSKKKKGTIDLREKHRGVYCLGAGCFSAVTYITGPRYVCAVCPPSLDLCGDCYSSGTAHDMTHTFKRFDKRVTTHASAYTVCPPQPTGAYHGFVCDGLLCSGSKTYIVGARYCCADCRQPSVDLCQRCYQSQRCHDPAHSFRRYHGLHLLALLPPQVPHVIPEYQQQVHYPVASQAQPSMMNGLYDPHQAAGSHQSQSQENRLEEQVHEFVENVQEAYQEAQEEAERQAFLAALRHRHEEALASVQCQMEMAENEEMDTTVFEWDSMEPFE